jgi:hypothetical protein
LVLSIGCALPAAGPVLPVEIELMKAAPMEIVRHS